MAVSATLGGEPQAEWAGVPVRVKDSDHPGLSIQFLIGPEPPWAVLRLTVESEGGLPDLRGLPLRLWELAARDAVTGALVGLEPEGRRKWAAQEVAARFPELVGATGHAARRYRSMLWLAEVAAVYRVALASGLPHPTKVVAEVLDLTPAAAGSLVHRARAAKFLGPAGSRGGERFEGDPGTESPMA
jgi:hypothetical protein